MLVAEMNQEGMFNMAYVIVAVVWLVVGAFIGHRFARMNG